MAQEFEIQIQDATSMSPLLRKGDIAHVHSSPEMTLTIGSLYLFRSGNEFVIHRYLGTRFRGDNTLLSEKVGPDKIFGEVIKIERDQKLFDLNPHSSAWPVISIYPDWAPRRILRILIKIYLSIFLSPKENCIEVKP